MDEIGAAAPSPSSKSKSPPSQANAELLQAVRALSDQVDALHSQIEQKSLREMVEKKGGGSPNKDTSATTSQDPPSDTGNVQPIKPGVYVDLTTLLPRVKTEKSSEAGSGDAKRKVTIESFDQWLEAWSVYEEKLMVLTRIDISSSLTTETSFKKPTVNSSGPPSTTTTCNFE